MATSDRESELRDDIFSLVQELGFQVVEIRSASVKGRFHLDIVIYRPEGILIDDCAAVHKVIMPRAELILDDRDVAVQIASPGIDRTLKEDREFAVFAGRGVQILLRNADEWIGGIIDSADEQSVILISGQQRQSVAFAEIQKARLDYSQEVKKDHGR